MGDATALFRKIRKELPAAPTGNPFSDASHLVALPLEVPPASSLPRKSRIRVAMVAMPQVDGTLRAGSAADCEDPDVDHAALRRVLYPQSEKQRPDYTAAFHEALEYCAAESHADVIIFNELGLPAYGGRPLRQALRTARRTAEQHECMVVTGTQHDRRTFMNTGYVFYPGSGEWGVPFHKQVSALSTKERITIPPARRVFCIQAYGLSWAVLVCLDLADYAVVSAAVRAFDRTDVILVSCYTQWLDPLEKIAQHASEAIAGQVLMVNYQRSGYGSACRVMERGKALRPPRRKRLSKGAEVYVSTIRRGELQAEKEIVLAGRSGDSKLGPLFGSKILSLQSR